MKTKKKTQKAKPAPVTAVPPKAVDADNSTTPGRLVTGDHVQYLGELLGYQGQKGEVIDVISSTKVAVLLKGATIPVSFAMDDLALIDGDSGGSEALSTSSKPRFRFVANTAGGRHFIPDLQNETMLEGIGFLPGEKIDLMSLFTPQQINRSRGLVNSIKNISEQTGLPYITVLESLDDELPVAAHIVPLAERTARGAVIEAVDNVYDEKLIAVYEKEEEANERLASTSKKYTKKTKQHGRASSGVGGR